MQPCGVSRCLIGSVTRRTLNDGAITVYTQHWTSGVPHAMITWKKPFDTSLPVRTEIQGASVKVRIYATRSEQQASQKTHPRTRSE